MTYDQIEWAIYCGMLVDGCHNEAYAKDYAKRMAAWFYANEGSN